MEWPGLLFYGANLPSVFQMLSKGGDRLTASLFML